MVEIHYKDQRVYITGDFSVDNWMKLNQFCKHMEPLIKMINVECEGNPELKELLLSELLGIGEKLAMHYEGTEKENIA